MGSITEEEFEAYEEVRKSGKTNMLQVQRVSRLSGLETDKISYIIKNYGELKEKFGEE